MNYQPFSVAMCVYKKDNPAWFDRALESISVNQTLKPNEIVLVVDGPIPNDIMKIIKKYKDLLRNLSINFIVEQFPTNQGHGNARRKSVELCSNDLIALMDSDDVSIETRFEKQLSLFETKPELDICGGLINEFINEENNIVSKRIVPKSHKDIKEFAKKRCPMNQMTVMFKKIAYLRAGGYIDWYQDEDYYLWLRMFENNAIFENIDEILVNVRIGEEMFSRRGGFKYYKSEQKLQKYMLKKKFIHFPRYIVNCTKRFIVQVLLPNKIRGWVFKKLARG